MLPHDLRLFLINRPTVRAYFGERVTPPPLPTTSIFPRLTYLKIAGDDRYTMTGFSGHSSTMYQLEIWAATMDEATRAAKAMRELLRQYRGAMGDTTVTGCFLLTESEGYAGPESGQEKSLYQVTQDWSIWHTDT